MSRFLSILLLLGGLLASTGCEGGKPCKRGKPCGNSCIAQDKTCHK